MGNNIKFRLFYYDQWGNKSIIYPENDPSQNRFLIGLDGIVLENYGKSWKEPFWESIFDSSEPPKISRFTGLKDKNNTDIYEGDIIKQYHDHNEFNLYLIYWNDEYCHWRIKYKGNESKRQYDVPWTGLGLGYEIAGNIFENPELIPYE